jgi:hypothetical protein
MKRNEILEKLAASEISVDEATRLLQEASADSAPEASTETPGAGETEAPRSEATSDEPAKRGDPRWQNQKRKPRWLHVHVSNMQTQRDMVRVNIPIALVNAGLRLGSYFTDRIAPGAWDQVLESLDTGELNTLVEVEDVDSGEHVHIYVD